MKVSERGLVTLLHLEGLFLWYGCLPVRATKEVAVAWESLLSNIVEIEKDLNQATKIILSQHQFDAIAISSFDCLIGLETIKKSKILRMLKKGNPKEVEDRYLNLNSFSSIEVPLVFKEKQQKRRRIERDIFCNGIYLNPIISQPSKIAEVVKRELVEVA